MPNPPTSSTAASRIARILVLLLTILIQACTTSSNPLEPVSDPGPQPTPPQPPLFPGPQPPPALVPTGTLEISITGGENVLARGVRVTIELDGSLAPRTWDLAAGGTYRFPNLPQGTHLVRLEALVGACAVEGANPRPFSIVGGETARIEFKLCPGIPLRSAAGVYDRTSYYEPTVSFHGTLSERYVIDEDGSFRLQFNSGRYGSFEYPGTYSTYLSASDTVLLLEFSPNPGRWDATAILRGGCLVVEYNLDMWLSDFEHGEYCRS